MGQASAPELIAAVSCTLSAGDYQVSAGITGDNQTGLGIMKQLELAVEGCSRVLAKYQVIVFLVVVVCCAPVRAQCNAEAMKVEQLIEYLKNVTATTNSDCVTRAVRRLGDFRDPSGVDVLARFLDFQSPMSERERFHVADMHDQYPAVPALMSIGLPALPTLIRKLETGELSQTGRDNTLRTISLIYRDTPVEGIRILKKASAEATTSVEASRLESAA